MQWYVQACRTCRNVLGQKKVLYFFKCKLRIYQFANFIRLQLSFLQLNKIAKKDILYFQTPAAYYFSSLINVIKFWCIKECMLGLAEACKIPLKSRKEILRIYECILEYSSLVETWLREILYMRLHILRRLNFETSWQ